MSFVLVRKPWDSRVSAHHFPMQRLITGDTHNAEVLRGPVSFRELVTRFRSDLQLRRRMLEQ